MSCCALACLTGVPAASFDAEFCFIATRPRDSLRPVCPVRGSACRAARSAGAAAIRCFNGSPLKLCSVSRRPHGSDSLPERRFRISRRLTVLRSRALSARREFYLLWAWLFHPSALVFVRQRGLPFFSLADRRTTNCPSTLKRGASQSKSLLNDRVRSLFGRSLEPLLSSGRQLPPLLLLPALRRLSPVFRQPFSPLAPLVFSAARFRRVFFRLSLCRSYRRFVSPRRPTCPHPAACRLRPTLRIVVSPVRAPSVCPVALSPLCPDAYTPNGFVFRTTTPCDPFRPRAGFHVKQTRTPRCFMSSTASRVNSRPHPLPGSLFHLSVLNDYLA